MKKIFYTVIVLLSLCLIWSCAKEQIADTGEETELVVPDGYEIVEFQVASETAKTILGGEGNTRPVEWVKGDVIDIFWTPVGEESGTITATATTAGPITQFRAVVPEGVTDFYATYPAGVGSYAEGQLKVRMPSEFDGTFAASNLMAAKLSRTGASVFQSVVSLLRFEVTDPDANSIRVSCRDTEVAKALRGVLPVSFDTDGIVSVGTDARTGDKTGDDNEKMSFAGAGVYYLPILADKEIQEGLFVEYFKNNIVIASLDVDFNFQLGRSYVADFGVIENIMTPVDHHEYYVTISGNGKKDGSSWANAFGATEFKNIITRYAPSEYNKQTATEKENALRNAIFYIAGGTYNLGEVVDLGFSNHCTRFINFTFDGGYVSSTGAKNVSGNPTIITGGDSHCVFKLSRFADLGVIDCNFEHSSGTTGGAAAVRIDSKYARLTMTRCNFSNNANTATAGALSLGYGTATLTDCGFYDNTATYGAAISIDNGDDAAIYQTGAINIIGCTFDGNHALTSGAAIRLNSGGPVSVENCTFTDNSSDDAGGAMIVTNAKETFTVTNCTFGTSGKGNTSGGDGGAVRIANGSVNAVFDDCTFTDNSAANAGGISLQTSFSGTVTVSGGSFTNCSASNNGGAIYHGSGTLVVDGASFDGCHADKFGGAYGTTDSSDGNARFKNCDFGKVTRNAALERGGCIYSNSPNVTTTSHTFTDCWISGQVVGGSSDVNGGGVRVGGGASPAFTRCTFDNCSAEDSGAVHIAGSSAPTFTNCTFSNCENVGSSKNGGAVRMSSAATHPTFTSCHFINCVSSYRGGAVYSESTYTGGITFSGCEFEGCYAPDEGGALDLRSGQPAVYNITNCNFHDNYGPWGTLYSYSSSSENRITLNVVGCTFKDNLGQTKNDSAWQKGAAIYPSTRFTVNISNSEFNGNVAGLGPAVYLASSTTEVHCTNVKFINNEAKTNGGVFCTGADGTKLYCNGATFDGNKAQLSAVYYANNAVNCAYFNSCVFKNNHWTSNYGGVIRAEESKTIKYGFNNCSFLKNVSQISSVSNNYVGCWFNLGNFSGSILFSNSSITGQPENEPSNNGVKASGFMRVEKMSTANRLKFVNTIIANTRNSGTTYGASFTLRSGSAGYSPNFNANWCIFSDWVNQSNASGLTLTGTGNLGGDQSTHVLGNTTWFPGWGWKKLDGTTDWDYAGFTSLPTSFTPTTLDNVNAKIQEEDSAFYDWLSSISALNKDIRGYTRAATTWPGVYDKNATN